MEKLQVHAVTKYLYLKNDAAKDFYEMKKT